MPNGLLLLNKPSGTRSAPCVAAVKRQLGKTVKTGHGGTLDSTAEGLLVILTGAATRTSEIVMALPKVYHVHFRLGEERDTDDYSGNVVFSGPVPEDAEEGIRRHSFRFLGTRLQVPPSISAVRVGGERAHMISRSGRAPAITPRPVHVSDIRPLAMEVPSNPEGLFALRIACSKGTYIRSIVRDLGRLLGCGAHVVRLTRTRAGLFSLREALPLRFAEEGFPLENRILPLSTLADNFYSYHAGEEESAAILAGRNVPLSALRFRSPGILSPFSGVAVVGESLFSFGAVTPAGLYEARVNIPLDGRP